MQGSEGHRARGLGRGLPERRDLLPGREVRRGGFLEPRLLLAGDPVPADRRHLSGLEAQTARGRGAGGENASGQGRSADHPAEKPRGFRGDVLVRRHPAYTEDRPR
ncbi:MAG: LEPR-XLL domain-containing protein [Candidatus Aminicenantes bacterium RBG_16_66_30]